MNDERFFDLAMKVIARQAGDAERAELDALLAREPELRAEFARLQADARVAKDVLPLANANGCRRKCGRRSVIQQQSRNRIKVWRGDGGGFWA